MGKKRRGDIAIVGGQDERGLTIWKIVGSDLTLTHRQLYRDGCEVPLETKPTDLLLLLLQSPGLLLTKEELMARLWDGRLVTDSVLSSCVNKLRGALGPEAARLIKTVHGYGYRFIGEVECTTVPVGPLQQPAVAPPAVAPVDVSYKCNERAQDQQPAGLIPHPGLTALRIEDPAEIARQSRMPFGAMKRTWRVDQLSPPRPALSTGLFGLLLIGALLAERVMLQRELVKPLACQASSAATR